jgi:hypothetical protein
LVGLFGRPARNAAEARNEKELAAGTDSGDELLGYLTVAALPKLAERPQA